MTKKIDNIIIYIMYIITLLKQKMDIQKTNDVFQQLFNKDVIQIINDIGINDLYSNLEHGFNSKVGIGGDKLSGGQRQMIYILRCFGKNNKIIILDEPTSSIDVHTKSLIMKAIKKLSKKCTLIIITHDKELLKLVERVVVIKSGEIVEDTKSSFF